jgi:hypothetical protein
MGEEIGEAGEADQVRLELLGLAQQAPMSVEGIEEGELDVRVVIESGVEQKTDLMPPLFEYGTEVLDPCGFEASEVEQDSHAMLLFSAF